ncbi:MAG TPA: ABC transporter substrate-binding protein [Thermohalobaculum sp.]|nr:ABC transporter substrate-binding protein [Thermohalobaculum sp.]
MQSKTAETRHHRPASLTLHASAVLAAGAMALGAGDAAAQDRELTVASWGGAYQDAQREAWFKPAEEELGITIREDTTSGIQDIRAQVMSGAVTWDVVQQGPNTCIKLEEEGLLEPIGLDEMDVEGVPEDVKSEYWIGNMTYGTVLGWRTNIEEWGGKTPAGWADLYNFEEFPGPRSMRRHPQYNLEAALIADGVPPAEVYDALATSEGVDRAFAKMEELKPHVVSWWPSGAGSAQLVVDGEADMIGLWNGRIQTALEAGAPYEYTFDEQILISDCWMIPKGAPNADLAREFIAYTMKPDVQARLPNEINYAPANEDAYDTGIIDEAVLEILPTAPGNVENSIRFDAQWWADNMDELTRRFDLFIQE